MKNKGIQFANPTQLRLWSQFSILLEINNELKILFKTIINDAITNKIFDLSSNEFCKLFFKPIIIGIIKNRTAIDGAEAKKKTPVKNNLLEMFLNLFDKSIFFFFVNIRI